MGHEGEHDHDHHHSHDDDDHHHHDAHAHDDHAYTHHSADACTRASFDACAAVLHVDPISGAAGDMLIAAFLDLGCVEETTIRASLEALPVHGYTLEIGRRDKHAIAARSFDVVVQRDQPARDWHAIDHMLLDAPLDARVKSLARHAFWQLGEAEAKIHRQPLEKVHFHEVGGVDAIVDIVGACAAIASIESALGGEGNLGVSLSAVPLGGGRARGAHGSIPVPAPAALELLVGLPTRDANLPPGQEVELVTPTGAALLRTFAEALPSSTHGWPRMTPRAIGYGAGKRDLSDRPNVVRLVLGDLHHPHARAATHVVLETNVDDATGEIAGATIEALLADGALDAWAQPITMKKGRPALTLSVLVPIDRADAFAHTLLAHTGSLGVRRVEVSRSERPRRFVDVETSYGKIRVKIADGDGLPKVVHPEMDVCSARAKEHGVPVREIIRAAIMAVKEI